MDMSDKQLVDVACIISCNGFWGLHLKTERDKARTDQAHPRKYDTFG